MTSAEGISVMRSITWRIELDPADVEKLTVYGGGKVGP